ncbi:uncharacterized protein VTP21DRAFT_1491 [Calcarisporiella thermophila]|uniref:uncharacterized protein n=1 Tax=Calcarisporiella thermophila TaxID=911321 RepID=UPI0037425F6E
MAVAQKYTKSGMVKRVYFVVLTLGFFAISAAVPPQPANDTDILKLDQDLSSCNGFTIVETNILALQDAFNKKKLTAKQLTECYIKRIQAIDPYLHSVIEVNADAMAIAEQLDEERTQKGPRGPLHGIPILVKDNIATKDSMNTTAGSLALLHSKVPRDAFIIKKLREAGAIILGKANLAEWSGFRSPNSKEGWSARGGQCVSPYVLSASPSASSSGSGTSVAANLAAASIGTETHSSITGPASRGFIVGIKPTVGLTSRDGIIPVSHSQDSVGPMTRTVEDAALILSVISGADVRDAATEVVKGKQLLNYTEYLKKDLQGIRLGVPRNLFWDKNDLGDDLATFEQALAKLKELGGTVLDPVNLVSDAEMADLAANKPTFWNSPNNSEVIVLTTEFKHDLNKYLTDLEQTPIRTLADAITFNNAHKAEEMSLFGQEVFIVSQNTTGIEDPVYKAALASGHKKFRDGETGIDTLMTKHGVDVLVLPAYGKVPFATSTAVAGYPIISVPIALDKDGLPYGLVFISGSLREDVLFRVAYAFEQATKARVAPTYKKCCTRFDLYP